VNAMDDIQFETLCLRFTGNLWSKDPFIRILRNNYLTLSFDKELFMGLYLYFKCVKFK
jgi:hypothetical protein